MDTHIVVTHGAAHGGRMKYRTLFHVCAAITLLALLIGGVLPAGPSAQPAEAAQHVAAAPLSFPGPATGTPTTQVPLATDFVPSKNRPRTGSQAAAGGDKVTVYPRRSRRLVSRRATRCGSARS